MSQRLEYQRVKNITIKQVILSKQVGNFDKITASLDKSGSKVSCSTEYRR